MVRQIKIEEGRITLGYFDDELEAASKYNQAAKLHFGEFAYSNLLPSGQVG